MKNSFRKLLSFITDPRNARTVLDILAVIAVMGFIASMGVCSTQSADIRDLNDIIAMQDDTIDFQDEVITAQNALINVQGSTIASYESDIEGHSKMLDSLMVENTGLKADLASANRQFELLQEAVPFNVILDVGDPLKNNHEILHWTAFAHADPEADFDANRYNIVSDINCIQLYTPLFNISHVVFRGETIKPNADGIVNIPLSDEEVEQFYFNAKIAIYINDTDGNPLERTFLNIAVESEAI